MKTVLAMLAVSLAMTAHLRAQTRPAPSDSSLFAAREAVWRDYFSGSSALGDELPGDFVAIQAGDSSWADRAGTLVGSRRSAAAGTRLTSLRFPRNVVQRYGNVAIIHSRYEMILERRGSARTTSGQITEVFVWTGRRWIHPSWHME